MGSKIITPKSLVNNAAKNDHLGDDGDFNFTIDDLLANDPGGANKNGKFFFGENAYDQTHQSEYMASHGITDNHNGTYSLTSSAIDFNYSVQIGNNGTWSTADVDVTAPVVAPPKDTHHNGALAAEWTFENHTAAQGDNVGTPSGFWDMSQFVTDYEASHPGFTFGEDPGTGFTNNIQVHGLDGARALDTAGSPGNIFLQAIMPGYNGASMPDLVEGQQYHAEVSVLKQSYPGQVDGHIGTDPNAMVQFKFNDSVLEVKASDIHVDNEFVHFDLTFNGAAGQDSFFIQSHGTDLNPQGLLIDSIQIHDWVV